jgi:zinc protease
MFLAPEPLTLVPLELEKARPGGIAAVGLSGAIAQDPGWLVVPLTVIAVVEIELPTVALTGDTSGLDTRVVAMVGDFDPSAAIDAVARTLGALPTRDPKPDFVAERSVSFPSRALSQVYQSGAGGTRSAIVIVWPTTDGHDYRIADRLDLLARVFTGRLRRVLPDKGTGDPLPIARSDASTTFPGYGTMTVDVSTDAASAIDTGKNVLATADVMQRRGVLDDETARARQAALTAADVAARTNDYWIVSVLAAAQEHPERLEAARKLHDDLSSVTAADLGELAAHFLDPARASTFLISPESAGP